MAAPAVRQRKVLSDDQVAFYQRHGYLILENVLSAAELQELRAVTEGLREERARIAGDDRIAAIMDFALLDDAFMQSRAPADNAGRSHATHWRELALATLQAELEAPNQRHRGGGLAPGLSLLAPHQLRSAGVHDPAWTTPCRRMAACA